MRNFFVAPLILVFVFMVSMSAFAAEKSAQNKSTYRPLLGAAYGDMQNDTTLIGLDWVIGENGGGSQYMMLLGTRDGHSIGRTPNDQNVFSSQNYVTAINGVPMNLSCTDNPVADVLSKAEIAADGTYYTNGAFLETQGRQKGWSGRNDIYLTREQVTQYSYSSTERYPAMLRKVGDEIFVDYLTSINGVSVGRTCPVEKTKAYLDHMKVGESAVLTVNAYHHSEFVREFRIIATVRKFAFK